ncbi:MAG: putative Ig domain-containing protein, partial [Candidatus Zixiibacteriota bacterium]
MTTLQNSDVVIPAASLQNGVQYLIMYSASYGGSTAAAVQEVAVTYGATVIARGADEGSLEGTPEAMRDGSLHGYYVLTGDGISDLRIQFRTVTATTAFITGKSLIAVPLTSLTLNTDYWVTTQNGDAAVVSTTAAFVDLITTTQTMPSTGNYLVLMSAEGWTPVGAATEGEQFQTLINSVVQKASARKEWEDNAASRNFSYARIHNLTAGSNTFTVQGGSGQGTASKSFRRGRIVVFRAGAFEQLVSTINDAVATTTSNHPIFTTYLTQAYTPLRTENVILIGNVRADQTTDLRSAIIRLQNQTDAITFSDFISDDAKDITFDLPMLTAFGTQQISTAKTYALQISGESPYTTAINFQYGDLIVWSMTAQIEINSLPELATIGARNVDEGVNLNFGVSATDTEDPAPNLTTSTLPAGATFNDNGNGTGTFNWTPNFTQSGVFNITFRAIDDSLAVDTEIVTITVNDVPQPPDLAPIGNRSVNEGVNLNFNISATDVDGTTPTFTSSTLPSGATLNDNGNGTATLNWTPAFLQSGVYPITFRATDGTLVDTEIVQITVNNVPQAPVLAPIGNRSVNENVNLNFVISATDADGTTPTFNTSTLPTGATFVDNANGTATFNWTPDFTQSGTYNVTFRATDGTLLDTEIVQITVNNVNQPPVLATIGNRSVNEGANLNFNISATDGDGTVPSFTSSTLPSGATLNDNGNGTATFNWTPTTLQSGVYPITFRATDGSLVDTEIVQITVNDVTQPPVLDPIGNRSVTENVNLNFNISGSDPDLTTPTFTSSALPAGATLNNNGNGTATFNWTPTYIQSGVYSIVFRATDGVLVDTEIVQITVNEAGNQLPVLATIGNKSVNEGILLSFGITATDAESTMTMSASPLPSGATLTPSGNGAATFSWTPNFTQSGVYNVVFRATDAQLAVDSEIVQITVNNVNLPPDLAPIGNKSVNENANLNFIISATDPDATLPTFTSSTLPTGASLTNNGNGTATFNWTPNFTQSGIYPIIFRATDGSLVDTEIVQITVNNVNRDPVLNAIGNRSVNENQNLNFAVTATDPDGNIPTLNTSTLPTGATFVDNANGTGTFNWTPSFAQAGTYNIVFRASDGSLVDTEIVQITVNNVNLAPVLGAIGNRSTNENQNLNFNISASDPDGTIPT